MNCSSTSINISLLLRFLTFKHFFRKEEIPFHFFIKKIRETRDSNFDFHFLKNLKPLKNQIIKRSGSLIIF